MHRISVLSGMNEMFDLLLGYCHYETPTILSNIQKSWIAAVIIGNIWILRILLKHGFDVNMIIKENDRSTLREPGPVIAYSVQNGVSYLFNTYYSYYLKSISQSRPKATICFTWLFLPLKSGAKLSMSYSIKG